MVIHELIRSLHFYYVARADCRRAADILEAQNTWKLVKDGLPTQGGWYRVMVRGDSESIDGHTIYDYPDYETWAQWSPAQEDEFEDFEGGYKGTWHAAHDEEDDTIFAYCGPITFTTYRKGKPK